MRVHPTILVSSQFNWKWPSLAVITLSLVALGFPDHTRSKNETQNELRTAVVVLNQSVAAGTVLRRDQLALEQRITTTLPEGALSQISAAIDRETLGPIPAGTVLSQVFLAEGVRQSSNVHTPTVEE